MSATSPESDPRPAGPGFVAAGPRAPFYGWSIVGGTFAIQFFVQGSAFYTFSVLLVPLAESLGVGRGDVATAASLQMVTVALLGPWIGKLVVTRSIRLVMLSGLVALGLGFTLAARAQNLVSLYLSYGVFLALGVALSGSIPGTALVANWFERMRGRALGVSQLGITFGGTVMIPVATWLVASYGWRTTLSGFALLPVFVLLPLIWFVIVDRPSDRGQSPDGDTRTGPLPEIDHSASEWTLRRALRSREILLLALVVGCAYMPPIALIQVLFSHITDVGLSRADAATTMVVMTAFGALAKPLFGTLSDYLPKRAVVAGLLIFQVVGLLIVMRATTPGGFVLGTAALGLGSGGLMPLWSVMIGALVGTAALGRVMGLMMPLMLPFSVLGGPFAGYVYDGTGSYLPAYSVFLGFYAVSGVALAFLPIPDRTP